MRKILEAGPPVQSKPPTVLVVGMLDSIHLARWLSQLRQTDFNVLVTGTSPYRKIRPELELLTQDPESRIKIEELFPSACVAGRRIFPPLLWLLDRILSDALRGLLLARLIHETKPSLLHVNELQVAGYPALRALQILRDNSTPMWVTNYGSELIWYSKFKRHKQKLTALLSRASFFSAECKRDTALATELGFSGSVLTEFPVSGGLTPIEENQATASRYKIAVKGYDNQWGMGAQALRHVWSAVEKHATAPIEIVAFSCNRSTIKVAKEINRLSRTQITIFPKGQLTHEQMLNLFSESLAYVGASRSDGISTSVLEAMSTGAFPIQTDSSCSAEWFRHGVTGYLVPVDDLGQIEDALMSVLTGSQDLESARRENLRTIRKFASTTRLRDLTRGAYRRALESPRAK